VTTRFLFLAAGIFRIENIDYLSADLVAFGLEIALKAAVAASQTIIKSVTTG